MPGSLRAVRLDPDPIARCLAGRTRTGTVEPGRPAAVLVGLLDRGGETHLLLTRRADGLREHPGQYAFPGGRQDPGDRDVVDTALREAHEEVGIVPATVRVLGTLAPRPTLTRYVVTPVVAWLPGTTDYVTDPREVALVTELPLREFLHPPRARTLTFPGFRRIVLGHAVGDHFVWGATEAIVQDLTAALSPLIR